MGKVVVDLSMSLDGFITGPNDSVELPLGQGGERLYDWIFNGSSERSGTSPRDSATGKNREVMEAAFNKLIHLIESRDVKQLRYRIIKQA